MKVTVCFGSVRIVVPCGGGDLLVKDLIHEATRRYKKAVGKEPDSWVAVHHLQTQSGILDPDDCLRDVADDREQILASFEDSGPDPGVPQGGGDGASGSSSVGTGSPDIFRDPTNTDATTGSHANASVPHIEVTSTTVCPMNGLGLQVRRSSDPNLLASLKNQSEATKRWSAAAPACRDDSPDRIMDKVVYLSPQWEEDDDLVHHQSAQPQQNFARSGRLSMQFLGDGNGYKWMEAAEKLQTQSYSTKSLPRETGKRKEPLGQAYESIREKDGEMLLIINEYGGPLGLTALPDSENGGLIVQHVELGSRAERGRLRRGDRILEINGTKLVGLSEGKVQDHLRRSLESSELRVRVIRGDKLGKPSRRDSKVAEMIEAEEKASSAGTKVATVSPTRKSHTAPVGTSFQTANTRKLGRKIEIILKKGPNGLGFSVTTRDNPAGGHCPIYIKNVLPRGAAIEDGRLKPGDRLLEVDGLAMTGKTQTDVVSILRSTQPGASVRIIVSRQQELVEVDEREINFSEENELATGTPPKPPAPILPSSGHDVKKSTSSRSLFEQHQLQQQANLNESQHFIDGGSESAASSDSLQAGIAWRSREVLTFHIPVHDTEKAGLGVSVKGKTTSSNSSSGSNGSMKHDGDLGIFVKNVIHGGAASRDGRLRMNDQLLSVNGVSLLGQSNAEAMETLRRAMVNTPGKHPGVITLSVARKITRSHSSGDILESSSTNDSSNTSENSGATVIYLSPDKKDNRDMNRWSNPVLDRLTGGVCSSNQNRRVPPPLSNTIPHGLRNESYYMATNDTWSPSLQSQQMHGNHVNNSVLIEDDPEPMSPILPNRPNDSVSTLQSTISNTVNFDATYSSQLSLETNNSGAEHFSRDAVGRRSISEKHHAALDARETGTYQRNKKLREDRERERRIQLTKSAVFGGSAESVSTRIAIANHQMANGKKPQSNDLRSEALDQLGELGPSLGLKKSSSLESLQTMVQEIQMSDEPRGPSALRAPRGRGREDSLRAAVVGEHDTNKARKHWLLEETDSDGGFPNRNGPFQSSLNDGKNKSRAKKPSILRGIGHMFRFGKNRKDVVAPMEPQNDYTMSVNQMAPQLPPPNGSIPTAALSIDRGGKIAPPIYQPPPPPPPAASSGQSSTSSKSSSSTAIHQNDIFNHRYQHYANYEDLQQHQISRRHQHYHSQRSTRSPEANLHQSHIGGPGSRPASSYYEYETVQHNVSRSHSNSQKQQNAANNIPSIAEHQQLQQQQQQQQQQRHWKSATLNGFNPATLNSSGRSRGPFVTQVTIRDQSHLNNVSSINASAQQPTYQQVHKLSSSSHQQSAQPHASKV